VSPRERATSPPVSPRTTPGPDAQPAAASSALPRTLSARRVQTRDLTLSHFLGPERTRTTLPAISATKERRQGDLREPEALEVAWLTWVTWMGCGLSGAKGAKVHDVLSLWYVAFGRSIFAPSVSVSSVRVVAVAVALPALSFSRPRGQWYPAIGISSWSKIHGPRRGRGVDLEHVKEMVGFVLRAHAGGRSSRRPRSRSWLRSASLRHHDASHLQLAGQAARAGQPRRSRAEQPRETRASRRRQPTKDWRTRSCVATT